jgi:hypothetical protein
MNEMAIQKIVGYQQVIDLYGHWPSFHDAEVISLKLNRNSDSEFDGPTIQFEIHTFTMTGETDESGHFKCINHAVIEVKLDGVESSNIEGFNHQNAMDALSIEESKGDGEYGVRFIIEFEPAFGMSAEIICRRIEILKITLGIPRNSVYKKKTENIE